MRRPDNTRSLRGENAMSQMAPCSQPCELATGGRAEKTMPLAPADARLTVRADNARVVFMEFRGRRVTVMGLGRFGGGVGVVRFLLSQGAKVTVTDRDTKDALADSVAAVGDGAAFHLGGHMDHDFIDTDLVVVNPAVKPGDPFLELARRNGVPITTEINLFFERCPATIIGVTGSVGKTTTASMIGRALSADGRRPVWLGGNIGGSLLADVHRMTRNDLVVLEEGDQRGDGEALPQEMAVVHLVIADHQVAGHAYLVGMRAVVGEHDLRHEPGP